MKVWNRLSILAGVFSLLFFVTLSPVFAQCDAKTCDKGACPVADQCSGTCQENAAFDPQAAANCELCASVFEDMDLISACDYNVADFSEGLIFTLNVKNPELMPRFMKYQKQDRARCEKFKAMPAAERKNRLCPHCQAYFGLMDMGMSEEVVNTPNGSLTVLRSNDPGLVKKAHGFGQAMRAAIASFDEQMAGGSESSCCGTCESAATCDAKTACSTDTCASGISMEEFANCPICSEYMNHPEMMKAAKSEVLFLDNGVIFCSTVRDPKQLEAYQAFEKTFQDKIEAVKNGTSEYPMDKFCSLCRKFGQLDQMGAVIKWSPTATGTMTMVTSFDKNVVGKIHSLGKTCQAMEAAFQTM